MSSPTTLDELFATLGRLEHEQLDFKRQPAHLGELIAAFAMTDGGLIILGVDDDRSLHGCALSQKNHDSIIRAGHAVGVDVQVRELTVDASAVVVVAVPEVRGRIVTTADGRLRRRVGSDSVPVVGDRMAHFVRDRIGAAAEEDVIASVRVEDFDVDLIDRVLEADGRAPVARDDLHRALVDLDVAVPQAAPADPKVSVAAAVLFAKDPRTVVPGASMQLVRRVGVGPGPGPTVAREELFGPLSHLLDASLEFIQAHTTSYQIVIGARRTTWSEYPTEVLREALLNALAHRDYGRGVGQWTYRSGMTASRSGVPEGYPGRSRSRTSGMSTTRGTGG